jgi:hypothetical protein
MDEDLIIRGSIEEASLPELLRSICKNKESAVLTFITTEFQKSIFINDGQIVFAASNNVDDRLGESLLRYGKITLRNVLDAVDLVHPGRRLGGILCEQEAINAEELVEGVRRQVLDIITSLFQITAGRYELVLRKVETQEMILLNMTTEDIIFTGIKSSQAWSRISRGISPLMGRWGSSSEAAKVLLNLNLSAEESHIFSLCERGQFSTEDICAMSYVSNFETCRILWGFLMIGLVELLDAITSSVSSVNEAIAEEEYAIHDLVEKYNDLYSYIYDFAFKKLGDGAQKLSLRAVGSVQQKLPDLSKSLNLDLYGRLDSDAVVKKLISFPVEERRDLLVGTLEGIVKALLKEIGTTFSPEQEYRLANEIQKMRTR